VGGNIDLSSFAVFVTPATQGSVQILADYTVKFVPSPGFVGTTCFQYRICNVFGLCSMGRVFVQVLPATLSPLQINFFFGQTGI
jgi:hypothetical protein